MNIDCLQLLDRRRLPARLTPEQVAPLLGFSAHDIPVLVKAKLLKPLGNPAQQAVKYFAAADIEKCSLDSNWLNRATRAIYNCWASQNRQRGKAARRVNLNEGVHENN